MQVTKCDRCGAIYKPLELYQVTILKMTDKKEKQIHPLNITHTELHAF